MKLDGKVAIVTGAGSAGSGRAVSLRFARNGAKLVVSDIDEKGGEATVQEIRSSGGQAIFCAADMSREDDVRALFAATEREFGGVDVLVNNASAFDPTDPLSHWWEAIRLDLLGPMLAVRLAIDSMQKRGGGAITNVSSTSALAHGYGSKSPAYDVAKAGIIRFTTALGFLKHQHNIRVNCLVPDWIATESLVKEIEKMTPAQRLEWKVPRELISLQQIADAHMKLATDELTYGRILVLWCGKEPGFVRRDDFGYGTLEPA